MGFSFQPPPPKKTDPPPAPTGDAVPGDVRNGKTFSNADGINKTGTLPVASTSPLIVTPGAQDQEKPAGIYDGPITVKGVPVPADKVLAGTTIAGTPGTMPDKGAVVITPGPSDQAIPPGYHNGAGKVAGVQFNQNALLVGNTVAGTPGMMPNRSAENLHMPGLESTAWAGDRVFIRPPGGFYDGGSWVTAPAPGLTPENVRRGVNILGIDGALDPVSRGAATFTNDGTTLSVPDTNYQYVDQATIFTLPAGTKAIMFSPDSNKIGINGYSNANISGRLVIKNAAGREQVIDSYLSWSNNYNTNTLAFMIDIASRKIRVSSQNLRSSTQSFSELTFPTDMDLSTPLSFVIQVINSLGSRKDFWFRAQGELVWF